jgi:uncharacterized membrane protein
LPDPVISSAVGALWSCPTGAPRLVGKATTRAPPCPAPVRHPVGGRADAHARALPRPATIHALVEEVAGAGTSLVHPQQVLARLRAERSAFGRFNGWLADHIVGLAGTMGFFCVLALLMLGWAFWQSALLHDHGFDPYPYSCLFFILGGIMQSLFVPTMLTAQNRAGERDRIKDEADHRAWAHLYAVNDQQLALLERLVAQAASTPPAAE